MCAPPGSLKQDGVGTRRMKFSSKVPAYNQLLKLGREREDAILLDIGCCCKSDNTASLERALTVRSVGNDVRKAVADGFRVENVVATDIHPGEHQDL